MLKIKDSHTDSPQVNWKKNTANTYCGLCGLVKENFEFYGAMKFDGVNFIYSSETYGCDCRYTTVYPINGSDPECVILKQMHQNKPSSDARVLLLEEELAALKADLAALKAQS